MPVNDAIHGASSAPGFLRPTAIDRKNARMTRSVVNTGAIQYHAYLQRCSIISNCLWRISGVMFRMVSFIVAPRSCGVLAFFILSCISHMDFISI
jgi:hypothetical protein